MASSRYYVFQWKDQLDADSPLWKKLFFRWVYRPFNQFCRFTLKLPTFNAEECCKCGKRLLWTEHQGIYEQEWQALQACKTPNWGHHNLPYNDSLCEGTCSETLDHNYPLADEKTKKKYGANGRPTVSFPTTDVMRLVGKIAATDDLVL